MMRGFGLWRWIWLLPISVSGPRPLAQDAAAGIELITGLQSPPSLSAQLNVGEANQAPHTVRGTVVNSVTGEPIYRALVQLGGQYAALTDHEGHFEFESATGGAAAVWAMKPGYFADNHGGGFSSFGSSRRLQSSSVVPSGDQPIIVKLIPEAILSGTVIGQDGAPVEGILVQLKILSVENGLFRWQQRQGTTTNSEGQYRFAELEAGKYAVVTGFHTDGLPDSQSSLAYIPARYPVGSVGDAGPSAAEPSIALTAGERRVADLSPLIEKLYSVAGFVSGYSENRGVSFRVLTESGEEVSPASRFTARTGEFRLMLPGGSYQVTATAYTRQGPLESRRQITVPQAPVNGVTFALSPYAKIPVEIDLDSVNQPSEGQAAPAMSNFGANISLASASGAGLTPFVPAQAVGGHGRGSEAQEAAPGPMELENVSPGRYLLQAQPQPPWYVASASCGSVDLLHEEFTIAGSAAGCSIRVQLRNDAGSVHVTLRGAESQTGGSNESTGTVILLPLGDLVRQPVPTILSGVTETTIANVAPGRYLVLAMDHPIVNQRDGLAYRDPETMRRYATLGQEISVTANGTADVEVSLARGEP